MLDGQRWQQVQSVFHDAAAMPLAERQRYLDHACGADEELRREVETLLAAAGAADAALLDASLDELALLLDDEPQAVPMPDRAGPWAVLELLGRGGMGSVYRARRADGEYARDVALKILDDGAMATWFRRFGRERRILAGLEHQGIARLYDSGVLPDGRPWLALELVRGEPIHTWCDAHGLTVEQRLQLFEQVVAAVDYAHRKLVVHRDLKPGNILVDEGGTAKLLDFGIARLLDPEADDDDAEPLTRASHRLLTPEYASPEQLRGEPLSTASDVYSLGVLLFFLLAGRRPAGSESLASVSVGEDVAEARGTSAKGLRRQLRGELATLVGKALAPEPEARYPTAAALLDDLVRLRTGQPITARPPALTYRAQKFIARNRVAMAAAMVTVIAITTGAAVALVQAREARRERDTALAVSGFLENLFTSSDPFGGSGARLDTLRIGAYLAQAAERIESDLVSEPELRARLQSILGAVHSAVGVHDRAGVLLNASLDTYRALPGNRSREIALTLGRLGKLQHAAGEPAAAETSYREAIALHERLARPDSVFVVHRAELASVLLSQDRLSEADSMLALLASEPGSDPARTPLAVIDHTNMLAALYYRQGRVDEAIGTMRRAVALAVARLGADHPNTATLTNNLGMALHRSGRLEEAETTLRDTRAVLERALGPDHPMVGLNLKTLANVLEAQDRWAEADSLYRLAIAHARRTAGPQGSRDLANALHDHAGGLTRRNFLDEAGPMLDEALRLEKALVGPKSPGVGIILMASGDRLRRAGNAAAAERTYRESLGILTAAFPATHPRVLLARAGLALSVGDLGRVAEAESMLLAVHGDALTLADNGAAARDAARALVRFYEARGNAEGVARWQARSAETPPG